MTFCSGLDIISIYLREMIKFIQKCHAGNLAMYENDKNMTSPFSGSFWKEFKQRRFLLNLKSIKANLKQFKPILFRKKILQPKKRLISHLQHLLTINRNNYLVSWLMQLFTGFEWKVFRILVKIIFNLSPSSR